MVKKLITIRIIQGDHDGRSTTSSPSHIKCLAVGREFTHMKILRYIIALLALSISFSCSKPSGVEPTTPASDKTQFSPQVSHTMDVNEDHLSTTQTPVFSTTTIQESPTVSLEITPIPTFDDVINLKYQCLPTIPYKPEKSDITGTIILEGKIGEYYTFAINSGLQPLSIDYQEEYSVDVSPSGEQIFFMGCNQGENCKGVVENGSNIITSFPFESFWREIWWLSNDQLEILHDKQPIYSVIIINPYTAQTQEISLKISDAYYAQTLDNTKVFISSISPLLNRIVYFDTEGIGRIIMSDVKEGAVLAWLPFLVPDDPTAPRPGLDYRFGWSPDGKQYISTSPVSQIEPDKSSIAAEELFSINSNGDIKQLTRFSNKYPFVRIFNFRWSPNGQYIAFWLEIGTDLNDTPLNRVQRLVIYNLSTGITTDYCLPFGISKYSLSVSRPVWSSNSNQLAVHIRSVDGEAHVMIADLEHGFITEVAQGLRPVGWMVYEP